MQGRFRRTCCRNISKGNLAFYILASENGLILPLYEYTNIALRVRHIVGEWLGWEWDVDVPSHRGRADLSIMNAVGKSDWQPKSAISIMKAKQKKRKIN